MDNFDDIPIRIFGLVSDSIVDGPGLRYSVFVQGCTHCCPGCHNPESQSKEGGELKTVGEVFKDIRQNKLVKCVTLTGGEPFEQPEACAALAKKLKSEGYDVWSYSGYLFEDLLVRSKDTNDPNSAFIGELLRNIDVLVDGPFVEALHSYELDWRGSSNQRVIDVPKTLSSGVLAEWHKPEIAFEIPESW